MNKQKGMGLLSVMFALVVIASISTFMYSVYAEVRRDAVTKEVVDDVLHVVNTARSVFGNERYWGTRDSLIANGAVPPVWGPLDVNGRFQTKYGVAAIGGLETEMQPPGFNSTDGVFVFINRVPTDNCFDIVNTLQASVDFISVSGQAVKSHAMDYIAVNSHQECDSRISAGFWVLRTAVYK